MKWWEYEPDRRPRDEDSNEGLLGALWVLLGIPASLLVALIALCY